MKLNRSNFLLYLECPRHLWAKIHEGQKRPLTKLSTYIKEQKNLIKPMAKDFIIANILPKYPKGSVVEENVVAQTEKLKAKIDFLIKNSDTQQVDLYQVKIGINPYGRESIRFGSAFIKKVFEENYSVNGIFVIHLNKFYKRKDNLDIKQLFALTDLLPYIDKPYKKLDELIPRASQIFELSSVGNLSTNCRPKHCYIPGICFPNISEYSIFDLRRVSSAQLKDFLLAGVDEIKDIPDDAILKPDQKKQVFTAKKGEPVFNVGAIKTWLDFLEYPLYFLDYETFSFIIPEYHGHHAFDQIVFQYSIHVLHKDGALEHKEFLHLDASDPGAKLFSQLKKDTGNTGSVIVWNASFEKGRNRELGIQLGEEQFFADLNNRVFDLSDIFSSQSYDDPRFKGSWSIKKVLPILVPDLNHNSLAIKNGEEASFTWYKSVYKSNASIEIKENLLEYCKLDTLAMVKIYDFLKDLILRYDQINLQKK